MIRSVKIIEEVKPDYSWIWEGLVELPTECWIWEGKTSVQNVKKTIKRLVGEKKEIVCRTKGCVNPKHLKGKVG